MLHLLLTLQIVFSQQTLAVHPCSSLEYSYASVLNVQDKDLESHTNELYVDLMTLKKKVPSGQIKEFEDVVCPVLKLDRVLRAFQDKASASGALMLQNSRFSAISWTIEVVKERFKVESPRFIN
jgi:hypothetical protein